MPPTKQGKPTVSYWLRRAAEVALVLWLALRLSARDIGLDLVSQLIFSWLT